MIRASSQICESGKTQKMHLSDDKNQNHLQRDIQQKSLGIHPQSPNSGNSSVQQSCRFRWYEKHVRYQNYIRQFVKQDS